jgi:pectinesterase
VIHIKAGAYFENVEVIKKKTNLMLVGDGIGQTVVKASRNVVDGWTTFQSSTFGKFN